MVGRGIGENTGGKVEVGKKKRMQGEEKKQGTKGNAGEREEGRKNGEYKRKRRGEKERRMREKEKRGGRTENRGEREEGTENRGEREEVRKKKECRCKRRGCKGRKAICEDTNREHRRKKNGK